MTITSVIKKLAVKRLSEYGFKYDGKDTPVTWMFSREKGKVTQYIMFQKSHYSKGIRLEMYTSVPQKGLGSGMYASHFLKEDGNEDRSFWEYSDDASLERAINEQIDIAIEYGVDALDTLCTPVVDPSKEMQRKLSVDTYGRAIRFSEKYKLDFDDAKKSIVRLEEVLKDMGNMKLKECEEELIDAAAYIGEVVRKIHGGEWYWDEEFEVFTLRNIGNTNWEEAFLYYITNFWGNPKFIFYSLVGQYKSLMDLIDRLKQYDI